MNIPILAALCLLLALAVWPGDVRAQATLNDCPLHVVQRGETLRTISDRYLGGAKGAELIYDLNRSRIGPDPDVIDTGLPLRIPCNLSDHSGVMAEATEGATPAMAVMPGHDVPILTGGPFLPFVDSHDVDGGLAVALVRAALARQADISPDIAFVNDRPAHLQTLLPMGAFAVTFPWTYPDCAREDLMQAESALCTEYAASESLYELVVEFYARSDSQFAGASGPADLDGAILCRPEGYPPNDLYQMGLLPDRITLVAGASSADCLMKLDSGAADIASLDGLVTRALVLDLGIQSPLVVLESLTRVDGLRALARRDNPHGMAALQALNAGLEDLSASGEWYQIVQRHLEEKNH